LKANSVYVVVLFIRASAPLIHAERVGCDYATLTAHFVTRLLANEIEVIGLGIQPSAAKLQYAAAAMRALAIEPRQKGFVL